MLSPDFEPLEFEMSLLATNPRMIPMSGKKKLKTKAAIANPDV
jgi:hypothetical protein